QLQLYEASATRIQQADDQRAGPCQIAEMMIAAIDHVPLLPIGRDRYLQACDCSRLKTVVDADGMNRPIRLQFHHPPRVFFGLGGKKDGASTDLPIVSHVRAAGTLAAVRRALPSRPLA